MVIKYDIINLIISYNYIMSNAPLNGVNGHYVNIDNSHLPSFSSTDNSRSFGLSGAIDNSLAASASRIKGGCWFDNKMKITKQNKRKIRKTKKRKIRKIRKTKSKRRNYKGGSHYYNPYANIQKGGLHSVTNCDNGYSTGGILPASQLGLANPVPYHQNPSFSNPHYINQRLSF